MRSPTEGNGRQRGRRSERPATDDTRLAATGYGLPVSLLLGGLLARLAEVGILISTGEVFFPHQRPFSSFSLGHRRTRKGVPGRLGRDCWALGTIESVWEEPFIAAFPFFEL